VLRLVTKQKDLNYRPVISDLVNGIRNPSSLFSCAARSILNKSTSDGRREMYVEAYYDWFVKNEVVLSTRPTGVIIMTASH
jgi:hypothetical protein